MRVIKLMRGSYPSQLTSAIRNPNCARNAAALGESARGGYAVPAMDRELSLRPRKSKGEHTAEDVMRRRMAVGRLQDRLDDQRANLKAIQEAGDAVLYGEGLIEYARLLGELEGYMTEAGSYF